MGSHEDSSWLSLLPKGRCSVLASWATLMWRQMSLALDVAAPLAGCNFLGEYSIILGDFYLISQCVPWWVKKITR